MATFRPQPHVGWEYRPCMRATDPSFPWRPREAAVQDIAAHLLSRNSATHTCVPQTFRKTTGHVSSLGKH